MFNDQAIRLLREQWANATLLAEEIYAMMDAEEVSHTGVQDLKKANEDTPYFNLTNYQPGESIFTVNGRNGAPIGDIVLDGGELTFVPAPEAPGENPQPQPRPTPSGGGVFAGRVVSGTGEDYVVAIYPNGLSGSSRNVNAKQAGIDPTATIPAGSWGPVVKAGSGYVMLFPLWE